MRPEATLSDQGLFDALYASGVTLTTIGFGDVVPGSNPLRLVAVLKGAAGFGTFPASIAYLISVYLVVGRVRSDAVRLSDLGVADVEGAAALVVEGGVSEVAGSSGSLRRRTRTSAAFRTSTTSSRPLRTSP